MAIYAGYVTRSERHNQVSTCARRACDDAAEAGEAGDGCGRVAPALRRKWRRKAGVEYLRYGVTVRVWERAG
eukprot:3937508-Pleurochrysis_carterae.AAC.1